MSLLLLLLPLGVVLLAVLCAIRVTKTRNAELRWFMLPLAIDAVFVAACWRWPEPRTWEASATSTNAFFVVELAALFFFIFRARQTIWSALALFVVGLCVGFIVLFAGANILTDGRAII